MNENNNRIDWSLWTEEMELSWIRTHRNWRQLADSDASRLAYAEKKGWIDQLRQDSLSKETR